MLYYYEFLFSEFHGVILRIKTMFGSSLPSVVCRGGGGLMSYLRYLCLHAHSRVQHVLCCVFVSFRLVYPMLTVELHLMSVLVLHYFTELT